MGETLLPKRLALPVFCSDPLSSVAYATEYPNGGGAPPPVSTDNLGQTAALTAASALLVDYVLTVAVSVVAGVAAITSAAPSLANHAVSISIGFVLLLICTMQGGPAMPLGPPCRISTSGDFVRTVG